MTVQPRTTDQIKTDLQSRLSGRVTGISNFVEGSFNDQFLTAIAISIRETELKTLAAELAGYPRYAGKTITSNDLDTLEVENVSPGEINQYMRRSQLDELALQVGITRNTGSRAVGEVTFQTTDDDVRLPEGYTVGTEPDQNGGFLAFEVDADGDGTIDDQSTATVSPTVGETQMTVDVIATSVGGEYNVGTESVEYLPTPKPGLLSVTNQESFDGGDDIESQSAFRTRMTTAVFNASAGGTEDGIEQGIQNRIDTVTDAEVVTFDTNQATEVVVEGGEDTRVQEVIDEIRPAGVEHVLSRPTTITIGVQLSVLGSSVDLNTVGDTITDYIGGLKLGDRFSASTTLNEALTSDPNVQSVPTLTTYIGQVTGDPYTFVSGQSIYGLDQSPLGKVTREQHYYQTDQTDYQLGFDNVESGTVSVVALVDNQRVELTQGSTNDYTVIDSNGDGGLDTVSLTGNTTPDTASRFEVSYGHTNAGVDSVIDDTGTTYVEGTDFNLVDADADGRPDSLDFSIGGSSPADGTRFRVTYQPQTSFGGDFEATNRQQFLPETPLISATQL